MSTVLRLSPSAVNAYSGCPHRYARDHLDRLPDEERAATPALALGIAVHRALAYYFQRGGRPRVTLSDLVGALRASWDSRHFSDPAQEQDEVRHGMDILRRFYGDPFPGPGPEVLAIEKYLTWPRPHRGILAAGRLDLVCRHETGLLDLIDFKTGATPIREEDMAADFQAVFYRSLGAGAFNGRHAERTRVLFRYLEPGVSVISEIEREDFLVMWDLIMAIAREMIGATASWRAGTPLDEAFPRRPGRRCLTCPIRLSCATSGQASLAELEDRHGPALA